MEAIKRAVRTGLNFLGERFPLLARLCLFILYPSSRLYLFVAQHTKLHQTAMRRTWHVSSGPLRGFKLTGLLPGEIVPVLANSMEKRCSDIVACFPLEDGTVLDVGSLFGYYALLFSRLVGDKGQVYSFEPDWSSFQRLTRNLAINGCKNVVPVPICVSNASGLTKWVSFSDEPWNSKAVDDLATFESQKLTVVPTITLDEFAGALNISANIRLIKIDVEGAEFKVLGGMTHLLDQVKPAILCELHGPEIADEVFVFLSERDYEWEMIEYQSETRQHILAFPHAQADQYRAVISSFLSCSSTVVAI